MIEDEIKKIIEDTTTLDEITKKIINSTNKNTKFEVLKLPRWSDDAIIIKINCNKQKYSLKIHYDKYPLACHMYNSPALISKLKKCPYIAHITNTFTCNNKEGEILRCIIYPYISGVTLEKKVADCKSEEIEKYQNMLKKCTKELFNIGVNPFIRDLADFIVTEHENEEIIVLTDYNALMDCHNATKNSRSEIMTIMGTVIEKTVNKNYKPFISIRPTLTDI